MTTQSPTQLPLLTEAPGWQALGAHHRDIGAQSLRQLFDQDPERGHRLAAEAVGIYFDYSKNRVTDETLKLLLDLARQRGLTQKIAAMRAEERRVGKECCSSCRTVCAPYNYKKKKT